MEPKASAKSPSELVARLVVAPELPFESISAALAELGWTREPDFAAAPPLIPGEPEFATWRQSEDRAHYSFQPVVRLRVLSFHGPHAGTQAAEAEQELAAIDAHRLVLLLRSTEVREVLLGLLAAGELKPIPLYDEVLRLTRHEDPRVARAATHTLSGLRQEVLDAAEALPASLGYPGTPHTRRQALRTWANSSPRAGADSDIVLARALRDPDWEVRAGALIFAARLHSTSLALSIRRLRFPRGPSGGVHRIDGRILHAAIPAALRLLDPRCRESELFSDPKTGQIHRCIAGAAAERLDRIFGLITSLSTPHPYAQKPPHAPPELAEAAGCEFVWIPPVPHWLGSDEPRSVTGPGFWIAAEPCAKADSPAEAARLLAALAERSRLPLRVPTIEEREMAIWGADARRFPWGNGAEPVEWPCPSPWGVLLDNEPEWAVRMPRGELAAVAGLERSREAASELPRQAAIRPALSLCDLRR